MTRRFRAIYIIKLALEAGFTIAETRMFLSGFSKETPPAKRWRRWPSANWTR